MRLLMPTCAARSSRLISIVPASTKPARHRSISSIRASFFSRCIVMYHLVHLIACTRRYIVTEEKNNEKDRQRAFAFQRLCHLAGGHRLLRLAGSRHLRNYENALLDCLYPVSATFRPSLHWNSPL